MGTNNRCTTPIGHKKHAYNADWAEITVLNADWAKRAIPIGQKPIATKKSVRTCDGPRRDAVDANSVLAPLERERSRHGVDGGLGGGRVDLVPVGAVVQGGGDVEDQRLFGELELGKGRLGHLVDA